MLVEDEYTYFADDKPLLAGARVVLNNAFSSEKYETFSDESGMIHIIHIIYRKYNNIICILNNIYKC